MRGSAWAIALIMIVFCLLGTAQTAQAVQQPTLPNGQSLLTFGTWGSPQQVFDVNTSNGTVTSRFPSASLGVFSEPAGAGYDPSTGKTWLLEARQGSNSVCELWNINASGGLQWVFDLDAATTNSMDFKNCWSATFNGDGTAWVFSRDAGGNMTDKIVKIDLTNGAALTTPVQVSVDLGNGWVKLEISSLGVDPTTGQLWAAAPGGMGYFKLDPVSGHLTDRFNLVTNGIARNIYDMVFDANGRLWFMSYDNPAETVTYLGSIVPSNPNPVSTYFEAGPLTLSSSVFHTNVLWINGGATSNNSGPSNSGVSTLASTGSDHPSAFSYAGSACLFGIVLLSIAQLGSRLGVRLK